MKALDGYISKEKCTLHIQITNLESLKGLLEKAQKQADALNSTIRQLENFTLEITFDENSGSGD